MQMHTVYYSALRNVMVATSGGSVVGEDIVIQQLSTAKHKYQYCATQQQFMHNSYSCERPTQCLSLPLGKLLANW